MIHWNKKAERAIDQAVIRWEVWWIVLLDLFHSSMVNLYKHFDVYKREDNYSIYRLMVIAVGVHWLPFVDELAIDLISFLRQC
jgi:hypothetical protein